MRTSFSFDQRTRLDRDPKIDERVRPMAVNKLCWVKGNVCNESRAGEQTLISNIDLVHTITSSSRKPSGLFTMANSDLESKNVSGVKKKVKGVYFIRHQL